jgi:serine/threonine protein kinase
VSVVAIPRAIQALMGQVVAGRYLVDTIIGVGGMAVVFRGQHLALKRDVAIKVLRPEFGEHFEVAKRFDREARAAAAFDHPNCRRVFDCGQTESGLKFMAMQLLEGCELAHVIGRPFPPSQCIHLVQQILRGLDHAHQHRVIHRDLKPDNVFVTRDHEGREILKIVDFGIAKLVDEELVDGLTTKVGAIVGTPAYMSPEQALGEEIDARADLYALGIIFYELLTGAPPFDANDSRALMQAHVRGRIPPLHPEIPSIVKAGLAKLLARRREQRYADAQAALTAMQRMASTLQRDPTPWIPLLDRGAPSPTPAPGHDGGLAAFDGALRRVLATHTPVLEDGLRQGIRTPVAELELDDIELIDIEE